MPDIGWRRAVLRDLPANLFLRFVFVRGMARHFRSLAVWDEYRDRIDTRTLPGELSSGLLAASQAETNALLSSLDSSEKGLSAERADTVRLSIGPNEVGHDRPPAWWMRLWHCYRDPFALLLTVLCAVSYGTGDHTATWVIAAMVILSTLLRYVQETRSGRAAEALKALVSNSIIVLRPAAAQAQPIPIRDLVPGDVIVLSAGDMIPADLRVLSAKDLFVSQSAMTGESLPIEKFESNHHGGDNPLDRDNLLFMGCSVVSGAGHALVLTTGDRTCFGVLARQVTATHREPTEFEAGIHQVSWLLIRFMLVMVPLVLLINGFTKGDWVEASLFALAVAVGLTPEMLPMIVTSTLARGAVALSHKQVVVKRLDAIQNFGAMNILCTDKTGTLTQDRIVLKRHTDVAGDASDEVLRLAYLNSHYQTGLKNLLDVAVLEHVEVQQALSLDTRYQKVDEIPFDFQRRRMSVVVAEQNDRHRLICKGALEEVLAVCTMVRVGGQDQPLSEAHLKAIRLATAALNEQGLRVVAVAVRDMPPHRHAYGVADEAGMTLVGYVDFLDPPRETAAPALKALAASGISVKILTGDNEMVTARVCHDVGLEQHGLLLGPQVDSMSDLELAQAALRCNVFARLNPAQKERLVGCLRDAGNVVGFLGDGINDAAALRRADIGISVDSAVDIAKEAADIILLDKSLMVLAQGVAEGRRTFANMLKYIRMTASSNFGNVLSVVIASALLPFLPMLPLQLLVQNLLYDISQIGIPFDTVDAEVLEAPQRWHAADIGRFMLWFGPVSSLFDLATFALMWFVFDARTVADQGVFQSGWFIEGLLSQTLVVHLIRTRKIPFVQSHAAWPLIATTIVVISAGIILTLSQIGQAFRLESLPPMYFACLAAILMAYGLLIQLMKTAYARRFGWQ